MEDRRTGHTTATYRGLVAGFILFFTLTLSTLLDARRGLVFHGVSPFHALAIAIGIAGMFACYRGARRLEGELVDTSHYVNAVTFIIVALLVIDLFAYRGVPAARSLAAGRINLDWLKAFGVTAWWKPVAQATSFLLSVWHAMMLGILVAGLALTVLPGYFKPYFVRTGFTGSVLGALFALPQPLCSCCSSVLAPSFTRRGASTTFLLSFVIGAPMLNVTTNILALALLPPPFAITRIVAGVVVTVLITYVVARIADRSEHGSRAASLPTRDAGWIRRIGEGYLGLFDPERITGNRAVETPSQLFATWLLASGRLALVLVPALWAWSVIAAAVFQALPSAFGNNLPSVVVSAVGGTFFMISTWSEIPIALELIHSGFNGPAAALLVVLPAISLPCMVLLGGSLRRFSTIALLSVAVILVGIAAGSLFL